MAVWHSIICLTANFVCISNVPVWNSLPSILLPSRGNNWNKTSHWSANESTRIYFLHKYNFKIFKTFPNVCKYFVHITLDANSVYLRNILHILLLIGILNYSVICARGVCAYIKLFGGWAWPFASKKNQRQIWTWFWPTSHTCSLPS